jgi:hypothetical protein
LPGGVTGALAFVSLALEFEPGGGGIDAGAGGLEVAQLNWIQSLLAARSASARVARLDGSLLARHGFTLEAAEAKAGAELPSLDPLPPLTETP